MTNSPESTKSKPLEISIVIPIYNERENLPLLDEKITKSIKPLNKEYEVILVDDGSVDGSADLIRKLKNGNPHLRLIRLDAIMVKQRLSLQGLAKPAVILLLPWTPTYRMTLLISLYY